MISCPLGNSYAQLFRDGISMCCPAWNTIGIVPLKGRTYSEVWNSEEFKKVRCLSSCPHNKGTEELDRDVKSITRVMIGFDETCNIQCQTCRACIVKTDPEELKQSLLNFEQSFGKSLKALELCGSGDPIASPVIRDWLCNLSETQFPKLKSIFLQTNGLLFTEKFWNQVSDFVKSRLDKVIVSVDAATKETYEKIRKGGKWTTIQSRLHYIASLPICNLTYCFVVQQDNYTEIIDFYDMCKEIAGSKPFHVMYQQVQHWEDRISKEEFSRQNVFASKNQEVLDELGRQLRVVRKRPGTVLQIMDFPSVPREKMSLL